jgi:hypothetical protein
MRNVKCVLLIASLALIAGCEGMGVIGSTPAPAPPPAAPPTPEQVFKAFTAVNRAFQEEYERILDERGVRSVPVRRSDAFDALNAGLIRLGMIVESRDPDAGTLTVAAPAPRPLDADEWRRAAAADLPLMQKIMCPILGERFCQSIRFEPDGLVIVINATVLATASGGSEISLTTRMREIEESRTKLPRREYPPPTGVRMALDKIWTRFDQDLDARRRSPERRVP